MNGSDFIGYEPGRSAGGGGSGSGALPHTNSDGTISRQVVVNGEIWWTINADWNGTEWVKDVAGYSASGWTLNVDGVSYFTQNGGVATWPVWAWATQSRMGSNGQINSPGQVLCSFGMEMQTSLTSGWMGGAISFGKSFPGAPSSISFSILGGALASGPYPTATISTGCCWYGTFAGAGDKFVFGYASVS